MLLGGICLFILLIRTAWCGEDAYIAFRVVQNFLHGQGLVWNVGERVQVYTDPLFEFILIAATAIIPNPYWSSIVVSLALSMAAYFFLMRGREGLAILLGTTILLNAKGFMDFSVSGLENPASHLLIAIYALVYWRKRDPFLLTLVASLAAVNRLDSFLLFVPSLAWLNYRSGWRVWKPMLLGATPLIAWEAFSLFYYGFPFPNTAYAKLNTGIPAMELAQQGFRYLQNALAWDTLSLVTIVAGILIGLTSEDWPLAVGALLSMLYVIRVGGDYMVGRFLTPAFVLCCAIVIQHAPKKPKYALAMSGVALLFGLMVQYPPILATKDFLGGQPGKLEYYLGVNDERLTFYAGTGLLRWHANAPWPDSGWRTEGLKLKDSGAHFADLMPVGMIPYFAGPEVYVYDRGALGDALTARLPMMKHNEWRVGHYWREPPPGYGETLQTGKNVIQNKKLAEYYGHLRVIIRGDLWSIDRLKEIVAMNLGTYDYLLKP